MIRHIVLFRIHDHVSDPEVTEAIDALRLLERLPGVVSWKVERSLDTRKGRIVVEDATFHNEAAFNAFRAHPEHVAVGLRMSAIADWWNGDYVAPPGDGQ